MRTYSIEAVMLDAEAISYEITAAPNNSFLMIETDKIGRFQLRIMHGKGNLPCLKFTNQVLVGNEFCVEVLNGELIAHMDVCATLDNITIVGNKVYAKAKDIPGHHTLFIRTRAGEYDAWLAADYEVLEKEVEKVPLCEKPFEPIDISEFFNCNMPEVHDQKYMSPRPEGYSIGVCSNGRYGWEWNHRGHNKVYIDDSLLRAANGLIHTPSGIPFITPAENENLACVSLWDNFPTEITIPLSDTAQEIAILFAATTNAMQTQVENVRITVAYDDGETSSVKLIYPINIDDWLVPALQKENETFYFNDYNHATVQRLRLDPRKKLVNVKIEAIANEVIMGVMGISISR